MKHSKMDLLPRSERELVIELYEAGIPFLDISDTLQSRGFQISGTSIQRWLQKQPGYIPRSEIESEKIDIASPKKCTPNDELSPLTYEVPTIPKNPDDRAKATIAGFEALLFSALSACNQAFEKHFQGEIKYPIEQIKGLSTVMAMCHQITGRNRYDKLGKNVLDFESALATDESSNSVDEMLDILKNMQ